MWNALNSYYTAAAAAAALPVASTTLDDTGSKNLVSTMFVS